jgi:hypothetical protein
MGNHWPQQGIEGERVPLLPFFCESERAWPARYWA